MVYEIMETKRDIFGDELPPPEVTKLLENEFEFKREFWEFRREHKEKFDPFVLLDNIEKIESRLKDVRNRNKDKDEKLLSDNQWWLVMCDDTALENFWLSKGCVSVSKIRKRRREKDFMVEYWKGRKKTCAIVDENYVKTLPQKIPRVDEEH